MTDNSGICWPLLTIPQDKKKLENNFSLQFSEEHEEQLLAMQQAICVQVFLDSTENNTNTDIRHLSIYFTIMHTQMWSFHYSNLGTFLTI